jgi:uncharacterized protein YkwD
MRNLILIIMMLITSIGYSQAPIDNILLEKLVLLKINDYRYLNGVNTLNLVDSISNGCKSHSENMVKSNYLYHPENGYWNGENCGYITTHKSYEKMSNDVVNNWVDSPLHNAALLRDGDKVGIGSSTSDNGIIYFTYRIYISDEYFKKGGKLALDNF